MLNDLREIVAIDSVTAPRSAVDAPFGQNLRNALDWFLNKASSYGLKVGEKNGYCGWADYGDREKPIIAILAHIDIVPCGEGWSSDPLTLTEKEGYLYGRGVADDKGPLVVALHILKDLAKNKVKLDHRIRLIVGCDEESGSSCIKTYAKECEIPVVSLVPDADFPVINSEKGILHTTLSVIPDETFRASVISIKGGERANIVPSSASVTLALTDELLSAIEDFKMEGVSVTVSENSATLTAKGVSAHAMNPLKGDNAIWKIFKALSLLLPQSKTVSDILKVCTHSASKDLGIYCEDKKSGDLTQNLGIVGYDGENITLTFDFRLPVCANPDKCETALEKALCGTKNRIRYAENLFMPKSSPLIKTLLSVYSQVTRIEKPQPLQIGGGTYARELPSAVAFGPLPISEHDYALHNADENIAIADLTTLYEVYAKAIEKLDKIY